MASQRKSISLEEYDAFRVPKRDSTTNTWLGIFFSFGVIPATILAYIVIVTTNLLTVPKSNITTYIAFRPNFEVSLPIYCGSNDGCVVQYLASNETYGFVAIDASSTKNVTINVRDPVDVAAVVWPRRITFQTTVDTTSCGNDTYGYENAACFYAVPPLECDVPTIVIGGANDPTEYFSIVGAGSGSQTIFFSQTVVENTIISSSYEMLLPHSYTSGAFSRNHPKNQGIQCNNRLVNNYESEQCCNVNGDQQFPNLLASFGFDNNQGLAKYRYFNQLGEIAIQPTYKKTILTYNSNYEIFIVIVCGSCNIFSTLVSIFWAIGMPVRYMKRKRLSARRPNAKVSEAQEITYLSPQKWFDLTADNVANPRTRSWVGVFVSVIVVPGIASWFFGINLHNTLTQPATVTTNYVPLEIGMHFDVPITCECLDGCVVQTRNNDTEYLTVIESGATKTMTLYIYDPSAASAIVWPRRATFETIANVATSCHNDTAAAIDNTCVGGFVIGSCLQPSILIGGDTTYDTDMFSVSGGFNGSQIFLGYITTDGSKAPVASVKAQLNSIGYSQSYDPTLAAGAQCAFNPAVADPYRCCAVSGDTFLPKLLDAFGISSDQGYTKYNLFYPIGQISLYSAYYQTTATYATSYDIFVTVVVGTCSIFSTLTFFGYTLVRIITDYVVVYFTKDKSKAHQTTTVASGSISEYLLDLDVFLELELEPNTSTWFGVSATYILVPVISIVYLAITIYNTATTPALSVVTNAPVAVGESYTIPFTCYTPSGCVVQTRGVSADNLTAVDYQQTVNIQFYISNPGQSVASVWPRVAIQQTTPRVFESCGNDTMSLSFSCYINSSTYMTCEVPTLILGGYKNFSDVNTNQFSVLGAAGNTNFTILLKKTFNGAKPQITSFEVISNRITPGADYNPSMASNGNCLIPYNIIDWGTCCYTQGSDLTDQISTAFGVPASSFFKYNFWNSVGMISIAPNAEVTTITWNTPFVSFVSILNTFCSVFQSAVLFSFIISQSLRKMHDMMFAANTGKVIPFEDNMNTTVCLRDYCRA